MQLHGVFEVARIPPGTTVLPTRWILGVNRTLQGAIARFKARLVV